LATGGWGRVYKVTSNSWECTGDGVAMAYEAGAELMDMEMVQFHPTGMVWPPGVRGILVTEGVRGEGGILLNTEGERFMERYDPVKKDLSSRDVVARAIYREAQAGRGTEHGGAYLDITHRGADFIKRKLPSMYDQFLSLADVDITREKMEVGPTIHYAMGGVRVHPETGATSLRGLYGAGEVTAGLHGANRLGGNSLSDLLVFGKRAGEAAAAYVSGLERDTRLDESEVEAESRRVVQPFESGGSENPYLLHEALQETMQNLAGIARTGEQLEEGLRQILALQERAQHMGVSGSRLFNPGWHMSIDVPFMLTVCEGIIRSAILRTESRGGHWRLDYPDQDEALGRVNFITRKTPAGMEVTTAPIAPVREDLAALLTNK
jgi:succinate dehydrogenase / fumarate reductase flavoprotein subunit